MVQLISAVFDRPTEGEYTSWLWVLLLV
jgi:hypothetical protein